MSYVPLEIRRRYIYKINCVHAWLKAVTITRDGGVLPKTREKKYVFNMPSYPGTDCVVELRAQPVAGY